MKLSQEAIDDFKKIYFEELKVKLSGPEANVKAIRILKLMKLIYKPIPISKPI